MATSGATRARIDSNLAGSAVSSDSGQGMACGVWDGVRPVNGVRAWRVSVPFRARA